jgi:hypothetical protein
MKARITSGSGMVAELEGLAILADSKMGSPSVKPMLPGMAVMGDAAGTARESMEGAAGRAETARRKGRRAKMVVCILIDEVWRRLEVEEM